MLFVDAIRSALIFLRDSKFTRSRFTVMDRPRIVNGGFQRRHSASFAKANRLPIAMGLHLMARRRLTSLIQGVQFC